MPSLVLGGERKLLLIPVAEGRYHQTSVLERKLKPRKRGEIRQHVSTPFKSHFQEVAFIIVDRFRCLYSYILRNLFAKCLLNAKFLLTETIFIPLNTITSVTSAFCMKWA